MQQSDMPVLDISETIARDGFAGPFPRFADLAVLDQINIRLAKMIARHEGHPLYGRFSVRDWHFVDRDLLELFSHPAIVKRVASILGPDLLLWRTKIFQKRPGEGPLGWHQEWGAFNGEEIGNDRPSLAPPDSKEPWNLTVWIALCDINAQMGPIRFARGSNKYRYPIEMVPMASSEFFHDPFLDVRQPQEIIRRARENSLILDVDTSSIFADYSSDDTALTIDVVKQRIADFLNQQKGAMTLEFDEAKVEIVQLPMHKGEFVLFSERTMHGSSTNESLNARLAINGRYTMSTTLVYPQRLQGDFIDGSNIDIRNHFCCLVSGTNRNRSNVVR